MSDIVKIEDYLRRRIKDVSSYLDTDEQAEFLLNEGLDVLAAYRAIESTTIRLSLKRLIEELAKTASPI